MKIISNNMCSSPRRTNENMQPKTMDIKEKKGCYDKITIGTSDGSELTNSQFVTMLKNQISSQVKAGASSLKLNDIAGQLKRGQYDVNPVDIAKKIMLDNSEA